MKPSVSVVIPARNEARHIRPTLTAVLAQDYQGPLEVVLADGASVDATKAEALAVAASDQRLRVVDNPDATTPAGLNAAIAASTGEVIVRCDGHAVLPSGYVTRAVETLERTGADVVGGVQAATGRQPVQRAIAMAMSSLLGVGDAKFHKGGEEGPTDTVYLGVFRRKALDRVGLFDTMLIRNQDYELNYRIRKSGGLVWFDPALRVEYTVRDSLPKLWRQYFQYGSGKRQMLARNPGALRWRQLAPPALMVGLAGSIALAAMGSSLGIVIPATYALTILSATTVAAVRRKDLAAVLLPLVFPTMHLAWGAGFLMGRTPRPPKEL